MSISPVTTWWWRWGGGSTTAQPRGWNSGSISATPSTTPRSASPEEIVTGAYEFAGHVTEYTAEERQIGETGQVVEPDLYIAAGISGAVQHKVGMDESETIIAVNTDPDARIRDFSDYFIEGDLFAVLPTLTAALESGELEPQQLAADGGNNDD